MLKNESVPRFAPFTAAYWRGAGQEVKKLRSLTGSGLLAAVGSAIQSLFIPLTPTLRISFTFLAIGLAGYMYGPIMSGFAAVVIDIVGYLLNPGGAFFPGFTLNAFINGLIYGLWLYKKPVKWWRALGACATSTLLVSFLLNPLWLHLLYGDAFIALVWMRVPKNLIVLPINTLLLYGLLKVVQKAEHRLVQS